MGTLPSRASPPVAAPRTGIQPRSPAQCPRPHPRPQPRPSGCRPGRPRARRCARPGCPATGPDAVVVVRDADGQLRDLCLDPRRRRRGRAGRRRHRGRPQRHPALGRARAGPGRAAGVPRRQARHRPADHRRLLLRLRRRPSRSPRRISTALEKRMRKIVKDGPAVLPPGRRVQGRGPRRAGRRALQARADRRQVAAATPTRSMEVGGDELTIYDNLNPHTGERVWGDLCRGPHMPTTRYIPAFKLTRSSARVLARQTRTTRSCSASTAPRGSRRRRWTRTWSCIAEAERRDHRKLGVELDLFSFPDEIGSGPAGLPPQGRHHPPGAGGLLAAQAHRGRLRVRQHPAHHQGAAVRAPPATWTGTPTACSRRCTSTPSSTRTARCASPARTTTSSR